MRTVSFDTSGLTTKEEILARLGEVLDFPGHYGRNIDALADCLADVAEPLRLEWAGWEGFQATDPKSFGQVMLVLDDHAEATPDFAVWLVSDND